MSLADYPNQYACTPFNVFIHKIDGGYNDLADKVVGINKNSQ